MVKGSEKLEPLPDDQMGMEMKEKKESILSFLLPSGVARYLDGDGGERVGVGEVAHLEPPAAIGGGQMGGIRLLAPSLLHPVAGTEHKSLVENCKVGQLYQLQHLVTLGGRGDPDNLTEVAYQF